MRMQLLCENNKVKTENCDLRRKAFTFVKMEWLISQVSIQVFLTRIFCNFSLVGKLQNIGNKEVM